ncbi:hypothetical protein PIB30_060720, partial [Stylosanthes scabra]|nr:hypothetical protein [Stylosanthes scabra]
GGKTGRTRRTGPSNSPKKADRARILNPPNKKNPPSPHRQIGGFWRSGAGRPAGP